MIEAKKKYKMVQDNELQSLIDEQISNGKTHLGFIKKIEPMLVGVDWLIEFLWVERS